jgi:L-ascorbate metabolism protein UlaG (beta-lactamase superfamily)
MTITKFGHSCLLLEESGARILVDPGTLSSGHENLTGLDAVLITHEHPDHLDTRSLKTLLAGNASAQVFASTGAAALLEKEHIERKVVEDGDTLSVKEVTVEAVGKEHTPLHPSLPRIPNTGFFIANRFWYPGDSFIEPPRKPDILALPISGPWMKFSEAVDYALALRPRMCVPVHDGILKSSDFLTSYLSSILEPRGIQCIVLKAGTPTQF